MAALGNLLRIIGVFAGGAVWLFTTFAFFAQGNILMSLLAFFVPPLDLILAFFVSPTLGVVGIASVIVVFIGSAMVGDE